MSRVSGRGRQRPCGPAAWGPLGTWLIKHVVSPLDPWLHQVSHGRAHLSGRWPVLLLTTIGHRTGQRRVTPVFYLREDDCLVVCNVRPGGERPNPWPRNLERTPDTVVEVGGQLVAVTARRATAPHKPLPNSGRPTERGRGGLSAVLPAAAVLAITGLLPR